MEKAKFKKRASYVVIESLKWIILTLLASAILTPLFLLFVNWFFMHYWGYTLG